MSPTEPSCPTTAGPEYFNTAEIQEKDLKTNYMEMIEYLEKKMSKSLKQIHENTKILEEINKALQEG